MTSVLELRSVRGTGGGPEKTILAGAERHDRSRFRVTVCYLRDLRDDVFAIDRRAAALPVDYAEVRERHSFDLSVWPSLLEVARDRRADIVHGHDYKTNLLALLLARRIGAIAMATSHGWTGGTRRERYLYYPGDRLVLRHMAHVVAVSSDVKQTLVRAGVRPASVSVVLNGIDPAAFRRSPDRRERVRRALGIDAGTTLIGAVGRLEPQKRFDVLLDAAAALRPSRPVRLAIAGEGSLRERLAERARHLGLTGACHLLGHRLDVADLHDAFDLFVQSSEYEGTPNAVLEAMAMETPIVATDAGGTTELVRSGVDALVVRAGDIQALRAAIQQALDDPAAARRRAAAARERVEREFAFAERTRRLESIYDELLTARAARAAGAKNGRRYGLNRA
jgi:glycosyltransferase involved in cell wall biosynthesis